MPDRHTLAETERAMSTHVSELPLDFPASAAVSSLYRAANAVRLHLTNSVLREHGLSWTGFVVLWVVWIWDGLETRRAADSAAISKATLTEFQAFLAGRYGEIDKLNTAWGGDFWATAYDSFDQELTTSGMALMKDLYPAFNAAEAEVVAGLSPRSLAQLTNNLRSIVTELEAKPRARVDDVDAN